MNIFSRYLGSTVYIQKKTKKTNEKGLTKLISLNSVRPFCWFHTYYLITTRFRINNAKISRVIILLSNRTLSALKCPVYKGFQKIFLLELDFDNYILSLVKFYMTRFCIIILGILCILYRFETFCNHFAIIHILRFHLLSYITFNN